MGLDYVHRVCCLGGVGGGASGGGGGKELGVGGGQKLHSQEWGKEERILAQLPVRVFWVFESLASPFGAFGASRVDE